MEYGSQMGKQGEGLVDELKNAALDASDALKSSGQQLGERYQGTRAKLQETLSDAKSGLSDMQRKASIRTRDAVDSTDNFVKEHPWQSVGIGAVAGLVIGFLMMRR